MEPTEASQRNTAWYPHPDGAPYPTTFEDVDDELLMQLMLLDQQNKRRPGYVPIVPAGTRQPRRLDNTIGNMFVSGHKGLACGICVKAMFDADRSLWPDLRKYVHNVLPADLKTGPDLHQCFCGYFSFRSEDLDEHLQTLTESGGNNNGAQAGLVRRIEAIDMHNKCRQNLVAVINGRDRDIS